MVKILVVDDELKIREMITKFAKYEGFLVDEACNGEEAVQLVMQNHYDCVVLDIMMPIMDGFSACKLIKKHCDVPIIMLSALGEEYDRIHGFDIGVDDYVVKPFSCKELMMRIHAIIKRVQPTSKKDEFIQGGLIINYDARTVSVDGEIAQLSPKEYELLTYLVKNKGIALTRENLLQTVWGYDFFGDDRTLDTHIKLLRKNLKEYASYIVTLRGVGYRFEKND